MTIQKQRLTLFKASGDCQEKPLDRGRLLLFIGCGGTPMFTHDMFCSVVNLRMKKSCNAAVFDAESVCYIEL